MGYDQMQMYTLVADIKKYNEFIPGIKKSIIQKQIDRKVEAELVFGVDQASQRFVSQVIMDPCKKIIATCQDQALFKSLVTTWDFIYISQHSTLVKLRIDLQFTNPIIAQVSGLLLDDSVSKILKCFEKRAEQLYGKPKQII